MAALKPNPKEAKVSKRMKPETSQGFFNIFYHKQGDLWLLGKQTTYPYTFQVHIVFKQDVL